MDGLILRCNFNHLTHRPQFYQNGRDNNSPPAGPLAKRNAVTGREAGVSRGAHGNKGSGSQTGREPARATEQERRLIPVYGPLPWPERY